MVGFSQIVVIFGVVPFCCFNRKVTVKICIELLSFDHFYYKNSIFEYNYFTMRL